MSENNSISVNQHSSELVRSLIADADVLRLQVQVMENGSTLVDAGVHCLGGLAAGCQIARICMAGLGSVELVPSTVFRQWPWAIKVHTSQPLLACMASQYAGWSVSAESDGKKYSAMASGPGRAIVAKEALFDELNYRDHYKSTVFVLESDKLPPASLADKIASDCALDASNITLIVTPTGSLAGSTQVAARVVEVALHKAHELGFPLQNIVDANGVTPLPPPAANMMTAMGRTNDTILFGGQVHLFVTGADSEAKVFAEALPSSQSVDYGRPFAQVFADYEYDFFKIDGNLFSPAEVWVTALESGNTFHAGAVAPELIERSFGIGRS